MLSLERALLVWKSFQKHRPVNTFVSKMFRTTVSCPKTNPTEFKWKHGKNNMRKYSLLRWTEFFLEELNNSMNNRTFFRLKKTFKGFTISKSASSRYWRKYKLTEGNYALYLTNWYFRSEMGMAIFWIWSRNKVVSSARMWYNLTYPCVNFFNSFTSHLHACHC